MKIITLILIGFLLMACDESVETFNSEEIIFGEDAEFALLEDGVNCEDTEVAELLLRGVHAQLDYPAIIGAPGEDTIQIITTLESDGIVVSVYSYPYGQGLNNPTLEDEVKGFFINETLVFSGICENDLVYEVL